MPTIANRNNNPGNLRFIGQQGAVLGEGGFAKFNSPEEGYGALLNDLQSKISGKSKTGLGPESNLADFAKVYAPTQDSNDPAGYAANLANKLGVRPDTKLKELQPKIGQLAEAVSHNEGYKGNSSAFNPTPFSSGQIKFNQPTENSQKLNQPQEQGLGQELIGRTNQAGEAIKKTFSGEINPISGVIQTGGALAGGLGDIINKGLELIPGVKQVEGLIGQGIGALAKTSVGQSVGKAIQDFSTAHPELSADIGAGFNIATAIPILKGLGAVKNLAMDSVATALKDTAVKGITEDVTNKLTSANLAKVGEGLIKQGAEDGIYPELKKDITGKLVFDGENATKAIYQKLDDIYSDLTPKIQNATQGKVANMIPVKTLENNAIALAKENLENPKPLLKEIELLKTKYGSDYLTIDQLNEAKQTVASRISEAGFGNPRLSTDKMIRGLYQKTVEDMGEKLGIPGIHEINQRSKALYKLLNVYEPGGMIDGKPVKVKPIGMITRLVKGTVPGAKAVSENLSPRAIRTSILKRSAPGYVKQTLKSTTPKIGGLLGAALSQKANQNR